MSGRRGGHSHEMERGIARFLMGAPGVRTRVGPVLRHSDRAGRGSTLGHAEWESCAAWSRIYQPRSFLVGAEGHQLRALVSGGVRWTLDSAWLCSIAFEPPMSLRMLRNTPSQPIAINDIATPLRRDLVAGGAVVSEFAGACSVSMRLGRPVSKRWAPRHRTIRLVGGYIAGWRRFALGFASVCSFYVSAQAGDWPQFL